MLKTVKSLYLSNVSTYGGYIW